MTLLTALLAPLLLASAAAAKPTQGTNPCVVPASKNGTSDSSAIQAVFNKCAKDSTIVFQKGVDYNVFEPVKANFNNVVISMQGNLHLPQNVTAVQSMVSKAGGSLTWFTIQGTNVQYIGVPDNKNGWIYSYGQAWYDANKPGETGAPNRPHLIQFKVTNGIMNYFKSSKPIGWGTSLKGSNITVSHATVDARSDSGSFPFNTDAFDVGGTDITIQDSWLYNGDDAIAVGDGSHNILFQRNTIGYQTHGMSIGSLGKDPTDVVNVSNIHFHDVNVNGGLYAARFKSWSGGQGLVKDVSWSDIRVSNVSFPIFVTQTYYDQAKGNSGGATTQAVHMENFAWENFSGTMNSLNHGDGSCASNPCWYDVGLPNLKHNEIIILECATSASCVDFELKNIQVRPDDKSDPAVICMNAAADSNPDLGINCRNGTYVPI